MKKTIDKLVNTNQLTRSEIKSLLLCDEMEVNNYLSKSADIVRKNNYGNQVFIRGLIEFTNYCKNNCYYCGIRKDNSFVSRYRLTESEIMDCCHKGYKLGFRTFVLQGGEDPYWNDDRMTSIISKIRDTFSDCAITLSIGERSYNSYEKLYNAGANRFLLRHETATCSHYNKLHPSGLSLTNRIECLHNLKKIGFQTGCGFMVGSPFQTIDNIVDDLIFIKNFSPEMVGIGPFLPAANTPFENYQGGSAHLTIRILSIVRLLLPKVLLPATTALGTAENDGRAKGIMAGANVVMPNLSPATVRKKYLLYDNKIATGDEAAESVNNLRKSMAKIGYEVVSSRGDYLK